MKSTTHPFPLVLVPAWHRFAFWLLFAIGAAWGAVLGSALVAKPLAWFMVAAAGRVPASREFAERQLVHGLDAVSRTPAGAPLIVLALTLASAFLVASSGMQWLREREHEQALSARPGRARHRAG
jgi:predicted LPLAT superfamily acyltransferase